MQEPPENKMTFSVPQYEPPCEHPNAIDGYSLKYALRHRRKTPHKLPSGWRWLRIGEFTRDGDVCCDNRIAAVRILIGGDQITATHHPVRRRHAQPGQRRGVMQPETT